jgi:hypothetical protein
VQESENREAETRKEVKPQNKEASLKDNGMAPNSTAAVETDESQMTISEHPSGETIDDVSAWP